MITPTVVTEVTEDIYTIKFSRAAFNLVVVKPMLNRINSGELFSNQQSQLYDDDLKRRRINFEEEIFDRPSNK